MNPLCVGTLCRFLGRHVGQFVILSSSSSLMLNYIHSRRHFQLKVSLESSEKSVNSFHLSVHQQLGDILHNFVNFMP